MKPVTWQKCPRCLLEQFLWNCELEYDPYESSKAETVNEIMCNEDSVSRINEEILNSAWERISENDFRDMCRQTKDGFLREIKVLDSFLQA